MSAPNTVAVELFDSQVKQAYQAGAMSMLENAVRTVRNVQGRTYNFRKMGKGVATQRSNYSADVVPMNVSHSLVPVTLTDWDASEYVDIFSKPVVNFDEISELAKVIVHGLNRRKDQMIMDVLDALVSGSTIAAGNIVSEDVGTADSDLNLAKILAAARIMDQNDVPAEDRFFVAHANQKEAIMALTQTTSGDYRPAGIKPLEDLRFPYFAGFNWIFVGNRDEGGLDKDGNNVRNTYAFHKSALGLAISSLDVSTSVDWVPQKKSWLSSGSLQAGATVIDSVGIVRVLCDEDA